jgi:hypothetical protein
VRNLHSLFIEVTFMGASSSGIPPQGAGGFRKRAGWEPIVLVYHNRELAVPANLWTRVTYYMEVFKGAEAIQRSSPTWNLHLKADFYQQGASSSGMLSRGADSIRQPGVPEKTTGGRYSPAVRNLPLPFLRSSPWEPVALA